MLWSTFLIFPSFLLFPKPVFLYTGCSLRVHSGTRLFQSPKVDMESDKYPSITMWQNFWSQDSIHCAVKVYILNVQNRSENSPWRVVILRVVVRKSQTLSWTSWVHIPALPLTSWMNSASWWNAWCASMYPSVKWVHNSSYPIKFSWKLNELIYYSYYC